jgi:hypothetical protein
MTIKEDEHAHHPRYESCGKEFNNATEMSDHINRMHRNSR